MEPGPILAALKFRYRIEGDAPWKPQRVFDDGTKVYIQFPSGLKQGEAPPLFVIGGDGKPALVNYRVKGTTYIVDRLFAAAELRHRHRAAAGRAHRPHRRRVEGARAMTSEPGPRAPGQPTPQHQTNRWSCGPGRAPSPASIASCWPASPGCGLFLLAGLVMVALNPPSWRNTALPTELYNVDNKPKSDGLARLPATYEGLGTIARRDAPKGPIVPQLQLPDADSEREQADACVSRGSPCRPASRRRSFACS